jgi:hypothetical protein
VTAVLLGQMLIAILAGWSQCVPSGLNRGFD